ncbi:UDP-N-acetylglucosamine 1-carboxyvinyltransferase family protein [Aspergillus fischeri NRRL 181]|uniref:UDP-N-acetylglucosamine 1-carboxyvinyltransferase n=1 Tax=Neosartorya fischeri (strain ATCC 1020 / DSM 3700 / CBS 544.65 / FGSC A1164 / JCM 1740 / NRRL 181 / WB 181) TaxID=331117 RepID=A1DGP8_NEOFI|nr:udp-n-acetylglucosamine enolpyruvyl transferase [Aspergillus fischeri NRRL 181]EAW18555.1 udp-n-acetylglucosamine enolpyruvyl transferase [Aspergillus fischeri NRRL 181]
MAPNLISIEGGRDVVGDVYISGSKNAGLPIMAASILALGESKLERAPVLTDIENFASILRYLGGTVIWRSNSLRIDTTHMENRELPASLTRPLRASVLALGPLLARFGHAKISLPGGCTIGKRPIDEHISGLEKLGACVTLTQRVIEARVPRTGLQGTILQLRTPTVTGTMNLMLAACRARGVTHIRNAAREPEVVDLCQCLISMGMVIHGVGTEHLEIHGRDIPLRPYNYRVMDDRIEGGTFLILGAMAGNPLRIHGCREEHQTVLIEKLRTVGARISIETPAIIMIIKASNPKAADITTGPYPALSTDLQPQLMTLLSVSQGVSRIHETVFERRFNHVAGLLAMGAKIQLVGQKAVIHGAERLVASTVAATDLRAGASLVIAAISAEGVTIIQGIAHVDRGYERFGDKLSRIGVVFNTETAGSIAGLN